MTPQDAQNLLETLFETLTDQSVPTENLTAFFTPDYVQIVDGKKLDLTAFLQHADTLRHTLIKTDIRFEKIITDGNTIADIHFVHAQKKNGETIHIKVIAFYTLHKGRICRVEELTYLMEGTADDRDLGSRIAQHD
ncbi:nuclear transport factor 2 family protein [Thalassospira sp. TSL5-1]|uniref:nuclear transport factor 2 family protein n=1 Tax=Thalassospira sp. TSL5-1 TaxID=1544451 RepID=UPI00093EF8C8|nr:nuclear transport factor 2 family protein [Thalassospira sp. TSL5-1]OKH89660.1 hypothetical protein LF95_06960 [Thalassospira sp. TSL5-1]